MWRSLQAILLKPRTLLIIYIAAAIIAAIQLVALGTHHIAMDSKSAMITPLDVQKFTLLQVTEYNNYIIFKNSFFHLISDKNLYTLYPLEQWDYFKYTPTFSLFMGLLSYLPDILGLALWNILNALVFFIAIRMLPFSVKNQCLILFFVALELLTSMQNAQSNGLIAGLMIAAYGCMQRKKAIWATLWIVAAMYIKVYGAIGFALFLFYPEKAKFILYALLWTIILAAAPLLVTSYSTLVWQYQNWIALTKADVAVSSGLSVSGWLYTWFGINGKIYITITGILLFLLPFIRFQLYRNEVYKLLILTSMLIWVIIFNHKAESPTYIIAMAGVAIWYFAIQSSSWRTFLFWVAFIFTSLATTDIFPPYIRRHFIIPYSIKALPCIIIWCVITIDLMRLKKDEKLSITTANQLV